MKHKGNITLSQQLSLERAWIRSLLRSKSPNIHLIEQIQKTIADIKHRLITCVGIKPKHSKYD